MQSFPLLAVSLALAFLRPGNAASSAPFRGVASRPASSLAAVKAKVTPEDVQLCLSFASEVVRASEPPARAVERCVDRCALSKRVDDENFICPHLKAGLSKALQSLPPSTPLDARRFCEVTEEYMLSVRGATRVPNVGSGPITNFKVGKTCEAEVAAHFAAGSASVPAADVPELWYSLCANPARCKQGLQSRTRGCRGEAVASYGIEVCAAILEFSRQKVSALGAAMNAQEVCGVYSDFVSTLGYEVAAYEHVVHRENFDHRVPSPEDAARALSSSRLVNDAGAHHLRDNAGRHPSSGTFGAAPTAMIMMLAALVTTCVLVA
eukprot:TRINITY_DN54439_c0_g1_i1.p1 TRINITY_DN54439_c0_g1~~TRINITY_DN54439_c0_g1_i1.p1  ORF type:complete len:322 (+),score=62.01 TRINITY_DN54439_c0_g1_i1:63-1028(+)